jgi:hypothetical protein
MALIADPRVLTLPIWVISGDRISRSSPTDIIGLPAAAS